MENREDILRTPLAGNLREYLMMLLVSAVHLVVDNVDFPDSKDALSRRRCCGPTLATSAVIPRNRYQQPPTSTYQHALPALHYRH